MSPRVVSMPWRRTASAATTAATTPPAPRPTREDVHMGAMRAKLMANMFGDEVGHQFALGTVWRRRRLAQRAMRAGARLAFWPTFTAGVSFGLCLGLLAAVVLARWGAAS